MSHPKIFPHPSHDMPTPYIMPLGDHFMGKEAYYAIDNNCIKCGGRVWGDSRSFDYDAKLAKKCSGRRSKRVE